MGVVSSTGGMLGGGEVGMRGKCYVHGVKHLYL